jgi:LmbE family N-acetylglucosaminyl deacetylase
LRAVLFSPHPDDIAISMGAFAAFLAQARVETSVVLATDGSESLVPASVLERYGWTPEMPPAEQRALRGRIRVAEALEEATRLGFGPVAVRLLKRQRWFTEHRTPAEFLNADLSLRDVSRFEPGPVDKEAAEEIREAIGDNTICAIPDPNDRLRMHRIVTELVMQVRGRASLLTYECLSTIEPTGSQIVFGFGDELLNVKCRAIRAHVSMAERRRQFGGYSNPGTEPYDAIVTRRNAGLARTQGLDFPYAERYGWHR